MNYCTQCRAAGHACYAQDGFDLCVFCEDGVPCTFALAARKNPPPPIPQKPKRERRSALRVSEIERIVAKQVPAAKPAAEKQENTMPEETQKECPHPGCGKKLRSDNKRGACSAHAYLVGGGRATRVSASPRKPKTNGGVIAPPAPDKLKPGQAIVSEDDMDRLWAKLNLAQKAAWLFN